MIKYFPILSLPVTNEETVSICSDNLNGPFPCNFTLSIGIICFKNLYVEI